MVGERWGDGGWHRDMEERVREMKGTRICVGEGMEVCWGAWSRSSMWEMEMVEALGVWEIVELRGGRKGV